MKTYKYKIAHFTPDRLMIWSKEAELQAVNIEDALSSITKEHSDKGYLLNVDYELVYLTEVK